MNVVVEPGVELTREEYDQRYPGKLYSHREFDEAMESMRAGTSSELYHCPVDGTVQGVESLGRTPGTPRDFNEGEFTVLRCGHVIV